MPKKTTHAPPEFYRAESYCREDSLGWLMRKFKQSVTRQAELRLHDVGLTHAQWGTLMSLRFGGPSSTVALVRELDVDAGALSRLLDRLESKGFVTRERSEEDRRVVTVALSAEGLRVTAELPAVLSDVFNAHLAGFSEQEWRLLLSFLRRMIDNGEALRDSNAARPSSNDTPL
ncbi:MarR family winged helix-turn-helix transcriptional regulator [Paucibacter sp. KCTC 42545]|uniref:MarR family winged helix-turn-helix transcriptional regulator n=1 Tax=Paucibacter sp. KCTC 42545 TaxID=1768242 RepID=UPI000733B157|nr:MarR family transcriptional regulator [Paucibacter sp. KCTC 42545]ALT77225.1 hypothetical protein AT984_08515 [Paucibacter sp. KCTC 42545]